MSKVTAISNEEINHAAATLWLKLSPSAHSISIYGVPRGGVPAAYALSRAAACVGKTAYVVDDPLKADLIVDDLIDSGATREKYVNKYGLPFAALFTKTPMKDATAGHHYGMAKPAHEWLVFPWEGDVEGSAADIVTRLLQFIGEDPRRSGLHETPTRVIKAWREWTAGYGKDPKAILKTFEDGAEKVDELVVVRDIPIYSHCEHHLAPFFGIAHIGYIPSGRIVGLSKLVRLADVFAKRLQVQERLTNQIADALVEHLQPSGVGVVVECRHMCMESRGVCKAGATTVTSAMRGALLNKPEARAELMALVRR